MNKEKPNVTKIYIVQREPNHYIESEPRNDARTSLSYLLMTDYTHDLKTREADENRQSTRITTFSSSPLVL